MQIVIDSGVDLVLPPGQAAEMGIHVVPLRVTLAGKSYREGVDIQPDEFYRLLAMTDEFPTTSQPSPGDFAAIYKRLAAVDPEILSIHMSSGLSGTLNSARLGAQMVPEAQVTYVDTKTLSVAAGWQVEAAVRGRKASWSKERILALMQRISAASDSIYTLKELRYLIHGGRISHLKGLVASVLNIKPLIGVEKVKGTYVQCGKALNFSRAIRGLVDLIAHQHKPGSALYVQVVHAYNTEGANLLRELIGRQFDCTWLPVGRLSLVLGAHTGPSMVGVAYAPAAAFTEMPS
ncbi:MAG: DegV family protein [Dehalococcoidales bacterium]|nr:DegV family protein [Dehalococcoidales bacterium]